MFRNAAEAIDDATAKVAEFRSKLVAHEASLAAEAGGAPNSGTHSVLFKKTLSNEDILVQRYWNGAIVGPDCRKFLKMFRAVLEIIRAEIEKKTWRSEGQNFYYKWFDRHVAVLIELDVDASTGRARRAAGGMYGLRRGVPRGVPEPPHPHA